MGKSLHSHAFNARTGTQTIAVEPEVKNNLADCDVYPGFGHLFGCEQDSNNDISLVFTTILHISLVSTMNLLFTMPPGHPKGSTRTPAEKEEAQNR